MSNTIIEESDSKRFMMSSELEGQRRSSAIQVQHLGIVTDFSTSMRSSLREVPDINGSKLDPKSSQATTKDEAARVTFGVENSPDFKPVQSRNQTVRKGNSNHLNIEQIKRRETAGAVSSSFKKENRNLKTPGTDVKTSEKASIF